MLPLLSRTVSFSATVSFQPIIFVKRATILFLFRKFPILNILSYVTFITIYIFYRQMEAAFTAAKFFSLFAEWPAIMYRWPKADSVMA